MKLKQLVTIRDSMQKIRNKYGEKLSNETKVDFDATIDVFNNIITDAEKERDKRVSTIDHLIYHLRVELR